ncbi:serine/threonine-protein phosphatase 6 regulatory ankyrin repeat subunit A-like [Coregonus clupeaformis]|uniref:serine/threonine-protein phosphatase 6 regulatory ankyrin repeat subunit A-like n=1 Tax=Coregonus clupeaformis TaxID=59861 RepID=UPI001E1C6A14|nr:serine/threonine-protein phosphatase 6 regulatory ankyrin repeat subunit A-like [Coregonus clupeaformis]
MRSVWRPCCSTAPASWFGTVRGEPLSTWRRHPDTSGCWGALHAAQSVETLPVITDNQGYTPLHWACYNGHDTCVEVLLEQEVFHKTEGNSFSPLHCAVINDNEGAAEMLIDTLGPAIVNATDTKNR